MSPEDEEVEDEEADDNSATEGFEPDHDELPADHVQQHGGGLEYLRHPIRMW